MRRIRQRISIATQGQDEAFTLVGGDPFLSGSNVGLRIPQFPSQATGAPPYFFMLCNYQLQARERVRLIDLGQLLTIGTQITIGAGNNTKVQAFEKLVDSPWWHFIDGWVTWHLFVLPPIDLLEQSQSPPFNLNELLTNQAYRWSNSPALLSETPPLDVVGYTPPFGGRLPVQASAVIPDLLTFHDIRFPWQYKATETIDSWIAGPGTLAFCAYVQQTTTNGDNPRPQATIPTAMIPYVAPEDAFVYEVSLDSAAATSAVYWRIGGRMTIEREIMEPGPPYACGPSVPCEAAGGGEIPGLPPPPLPHRPEPGPHPTIPSPPPPHPEAPNPSRSDR